jgi:alpha-ketoglutarate-dependent taurine dioxygenase
MRARSELEDAVAALEASPIAGAPFGLEVKLDLSDKLSLAQQQALRRLYSQDGLILVRAQKLSMAQQIEACSILGPVLRNSRENY